MALAAQARLQLHLAGWAQAGALARLFLGKALGPGLACVTDAGGALFIDLPANVAGCFVMGLLATSDALGHDLRLPGGPAAALAALPPGHGLQSHAALHVGLRTGFCGSLTTFASWHLQAVAMMAGDTPAGASRGGWVAAFASLLLGWLVALAAHAGGQHVAAALWQGYAAGAAGGGGPGTAAAVAAPQPLHKEPREEEEDALAALEASAEVHVEAAPEAPPPPRNASRLAADALALAALAALTAISVARLVSGPERDDGRVWASLLLAPPGALLRLRLGALNGRAGWLPAGTLAANLLASAVDFGMAAILVRSGGGLSPGRAAAIAGVIGGFGGCLSTVSTVAVEARKLLAARRGGAAAAYLFGSSAAAVALGLLIYGTAAWTAPP